MPIVLVTYIAIVGVSPTHEWRSTVAEQWTYTRQIHTCHHGAYIQSTLTVLVTDMLNIHEDMRENGWFRNQVCFPQHI